VGHEAGRPGAVPAEHINGRPERNYWRLVYQLSATERWQIGSDASRAADLLGRLARERGHQLENHH
jgi:hypothetical protein